MGYAYTYNQSWLKHRISSGQWLRHPGWIIKDVLVKPYLVGDSAFAWSPYLILGFQYPPQPGLQANFNAAVNAARKVSEIAFGRLKGRYHILVDNHINDPLFASDIALSCAALHNVNAQNVLLKHRGFQMKLCTQVVHILQKRKL